MKGDFSRVTFDPRKHFSAVRLQQGRVQLDADFNEHVDIEAHRDAETTLDVVGAAGVPVEGGGFRVALSTRLRGVALSGTTAWAVGDDALLLTSTGAEGWTSAAPPDGTGDLQAVALTAADAGYAVADDATILVLTATGWSREAAPTGVAADLHGIAVVGTEAWAVGDASTILYRGSAGWVKQTAPEGVDATLRAVDLYDGDHGWAVGDGGTILRTDDGTTWERQAAPRATATLHAVTALDADHAWAVGEGGTIIGWDGSEWRAQGSPVTASLRAVHFLADGETGTAVGDDGTILETFDGGGEWTPQTLPDNGEKADLYGLAVQPGGALAVGDDASLARGAEGWEAGPALPANGRSLVLSAGDAYVEGIRVVNENAVALTSQPDLGFTRPPATSPEPVFPPAAGAGTYGVYLEVFDEHVTALEREELREVALGGPDTATRTRTVWQAKLALVDATTACEAFASQLPREPGGDARLRARAEPGQEPEEECMAAVGGGYRRLENQLYRVEIHETTEEEGRATFKWSRDNGMVVARLEAVDHATASVTVSDPGRDEALAFGPRQWIELNDESRALRGQPGVLLRVKVVRGNVLEIEPSTLPSAPLSMDQFPVRPTVRRWDGRGDVETGKWLDLEDGVRVEFSGMSFRSGDHWLIPARSVNSTVEWPRANGTARFRRSAGPQRRYAPLALIDVDGNGMWSNVRDCRKHFPPLTDLVHLYYVGGDGQEAMPPTPLAATNFVPLPRRLEVGVANGRHPLVGATVDFAIAGETAGTGRVRRPGGTFGASAAVTTDTDGIAACEWELDGQTHTQVVEARFRDPLGQSPPQVVRFSAQLSVAAKVAYDGTGCATLDGKETVQDAIDTLARLTRIFPLAGSGEDVLPGESIDIRVLVADECGAVNGAKVEFARGDRGSGTIDNVQGTTANGIASCRWTPDPRTPTQDLRATLTAVPGARVLHEPQSTRFVVNLNLARDTAYTPPDACPELDGATTVQRAIDRLASALPRLYHVSGDGLEGAIEEVIELRAAIASRCGVEFPLVRFELSTGEGEWVELGVVEPGDEGIATFPYPLGDAPRQVIRARLLADGEQPVGNPVYFNVGVRSEIADHPALGPREISFMPLFHPVTLRGGSPLGTWQLAWTAGAFPPDLHAFKPEGAAAYGMLPMQLPHRHRLVSVRVIGRTNAVSGFYGIRVRKDSSTGEELFRDFLSGTEQTFNRLYTTSDVIDNEMFFYVLYAFAGGAPGTMHIRGVSAHVAP